MNKKGFTLIELLVVIAIIGLLSTLAVTALGSARKNTRDSERLSDIKRIQLALEVYFTENNAYPIETDPVVLGDSTHNCLNAVGLQAAGPGCVDPFMEKNVPSDPGSDFYYYQSTDGSTYVITASFEGVATGFAVGDFKATPAGITQ